MKFNYYTNLKKMVLLAAAFAVVNAGFSQHTVESDAAALREDAGITEDVQKAISQSDNLEQQAMPGTNREVLEWTIMATYEIPQSASGLAWDGTYLYCGIYGSNGDEIYQIDPAYGDYSLYMNAPIEDAYGLTFDGTHFWTISQEGSSSDPATARQFDTDGNVVDEFTLQSHYMSGITYDGGDFWTAAYYDPDGHLYKTDNAGNVLDDFDAPDDQPWDLTVEGDNLWMADKWGNAIYQIDKNTGDLLATFPSEHSDPSGITWDGQYLWYIDEGEGSNFWLYKVNLSGTGQPVINVPVTSHSYGLVNVGQDETWNMTVQNTGAAELTITGLDISNEEITTSATFPIQLEPAGETEIPVTFDPVDFGALDETIEVLSNDPLSSAVEVTLTGNGVYEGPVADFNATSHNYSTIRAGASERWFLEIENHGDEMLTISALDLYADGFYVTTGPDIPMDIPVLGEDRIAVWFHPQSETSYDADIILSTNDPLNSTVAIGLSGEGEPYPDEAGAVFWTYYIDDDYDSSPKAFSYLPDLNDDGQHEVVVASEDNYVRCLNGNSDDQADLLWETEIYSGNLYGQNSIMRSGDLNADDMDDIIVGTTGGDRSVRALSGMNGEMLWKFETNMYGDGGWVYQVHSKFDYDEDGIPDVLAAVGDDGEDNGPKRVFCLSGVNGDLIWDKYTGGTAFGVIGVVDFTGDGLPDVVAGATNESESEGKVWGLDGADGDDVWSFTTGGSSVWALERLSDITGDGVPDVIAGDFGGNYYLVDAANGSVVEQGGFGNEIILRLENAGDLNGDNYSDIAVAHSGTVMSVVDGLSGDFIWSKPLEDKSWNVRVMNDVDDDDVQDIAVGTLYQSNYVYIMSGANGDEIMKEYFPEPVDGLGIIPDVSGDNSYDVIAGGRGGTVKCFSGGTLLVTQNPAIMASQAFEHHAAPNPFTDNLRISYVISERQTVKVLIRDIQGKVVTVIQDNASEGKNMIQWDGKGRDGSTVPAGVYLYSITTEQGTETGKLIKN